MPSRAPVERKVGIESISERAASARLSCLKNAMLPRTISRISPTQNHTLNLWRQYQTRRRDMMSCSLSAASAP